MKRSNQCEVTLHIIRSDLQGIIQIYEAEIKKFIKILQIMHNVFVFGQEVDLTGSKHTIYL